MNYRSGLRVVFTTLVVSLAGLFHIHGATIVILASDTANSRVNLGGVDLNNYNRLVSYDAVEFQPAEIDGFLRFELDSIPGDVEILGITLVLYAEGGFSTPVGAPEIQIRRSSFDTWTRGGSNFPTTYDEELTGIVGGPFPSTRHAPVDFALNVSAVDWAVDIGDGNLTLVLEEVSSSTNDYMYFFGSDPVSATGDANSIGTVEEYIPRLVVDYIPVPEPSALAIVMVGMAVIFLGGGRNRRHLRR